MEIKLEYDLTTFLSTIASASSGIVAILGGFIASKLISISGERDTVLLRLKHIEEEIDYRTKEREKAQFENDEDDALDFIREHAKDMWNGLPLEDAYKTEDAPRLSKEILVSFWDRALKICAEFKGVAKSITADDVNDDTVPYQIYAEHHEVYFEYEVCKAFGDVLEGIIAAKDRGYWIRKGLEPINYNSLPSGVYSYNKNEEIIHNEDNAIGMLELEKRQLEERKAGLKRPKGMKVGMIIFSIFSLTCIILPLMIIPFVTESYSRYLLVKAIFLLLFVAGLCSIFAYLIYLLRWND